MGAKHSFSRKKAQEIKSKLDNIKSQYILKQIFDNIIEDKKLIILKYNKNLRKKLDIKKIDLKQLSQIEIEIIPQNMKLVNL